MSRGIEEQPSSQKRKKWAAGHFQAPFIFLGKEKSLGIKSSIIAGRRKDVLLALFRSAKRGTSGKNKRPLRRIWTIRFVFFRSRTCPNMLIAHHLVMRASHFLILAIEQLHDYLHQGRQELDIHQIIDVTRCPLFSCTYD